MPTLGQKLAAGRFVVTAELPVIDGGGVEEVERRAAPMRDWVDAVNATDNTAAHAHASPLAVSIGLVRCGVEPIMQLVTRDRNRLALQADIVGASMHGIENVLCLGGDGVAAGDEPDAKPVFDVDAIGLLSLAGGLSEGHYLSGRAIDPVPSLFLGAVESAAAPPLEARIARAMSKADAGARFLQLQIGFLREPLERFAAAAAEAGLVKKAALIPSVSILRSAAALRYMNDKVPGIDVPDDVIERVESAPDQAVACFELAVELAEHAMSVPGVSGLHLISFAGGERIGELCARLGIKPTAERDADAHSSSVTV
ncbi:MAG TPA: methylenetetrahydrofolate reductase [Thermoleophilaceae bacterium]|nr:methylenetetrahydrofolate reductase [Thermoleophilaceae bacterium]